MSLSNGYVVSLSNGYVVSLSNGYVVSLSNGHTAFAGCFQIAGTALRLHVLDSLGDRAED